MVNLLHWGLHIERNPRENLAFFRVRREVPLATLMRQNMTAKTGNLRAHRRRSPTKRRPPSDLAALGNNPLITHDFLRLHSSMPHDTASFVLRSPGLRWHAPPKRPRRFSACGEVQALSLPPLHPIAPCRERGGRALRCRSPGTKSPTKLKIVNSLGNQHRACVAPTAHPRMWTNQANCDGKEPKTSQEHACRSRSQGADRLKRASRKLELRIPSLT